MESILLPAALHTNWWGKCLFEDLAECPRIWPTTVLPWNEILSYLSGKNHYVQLYCVQKHANACDPQCSFITLYNWQFMSFYSEPVPPLCMVKKRSGYKKPPFFCKSGCCTSPESLVRRDKPQPSIWPWSLLREEKYSKNFTSCMSLFKKIRATTDKWQVWKASLFKQELICQEVVARCVSVSFPSKKKCPRVAPGEV